MSNTDSAGKPKHAWRDIQRAAPPKRPPEERIQDFREVYTQFDEAAVMLQASRCVNCPESACMSGCPVYSRIADWLALAAEGRFLEAAEITRQYNNLPEICGRVCPQERLCEGNCLLNTCSDPLSIGAIEKFVNEYAFAHQEIEVSVPPPNGFNVAVVGSGPAGFACAEELAKLGYEVTVFDAAARAGGLLVTGFPTFKLERSVMERRLELLRRRGVRFRLGVTIGRDLSLTQLQDEFDAVFLAIGSHKNKPMDMKGVGLKGVYEALAFVTHANATIETGGTLPLQGKRIVVLGGTDTAMDCARIAIRFGAGEAICVYRRDQENMSGSRKDYVNAVEEGVRFQFLARPVAFQGNDQGQLTHVVCEQTKLGAIDADGRRLPETVPGAEFEIPADIAVMAFGYLPEPFPPGSDLARIAVNGMGYVLVDENGMTNLTGVFAGGDLVSGSSLVVHAVRDGRKAAAGIHRLLMNRSVMV